MNAQQTAPLDSCRTIRRQCGYRVSVVDPDTLDEPVKPERFVRGNWSEAAWARAAELSANWPRHEVRVEALND